MDLTPKRFRRLESDPPTGLKATCNSGSKQLAERKRLRESSDVVLDAGLEERHISISRKAHGIAGVARPVEFVPEVPCVAPSTAEPVAGLLILTEPGDSALTFEHEGDVYRVKDVCAFEDAVAKVAQRTKRLRRTLSDLKRAQRLVRACEAVSVESSVAFRTPAPRVSGPIRLTEAQALAAETGQAADRKLLQAWRLAKEVLPAEELAGFEVEL